jgi:YD repeat-containing protein
MLCTVIYPDGSTTRLYYKTRQLSRVEDPGGAVTDFGYGTLLLRGKGLLTRVRDARAADWVAADPATRDTTAASTLITYNASNRATKVTAPEPTGSASSPSLRPSHSYEYLAGGTTRVQIAGLTPPSGYAREVVIDEAGRLVRDTDAAGATSEQQWSIKDQLLASTDPAGRKSTTLYDAADRVTDTYGPAPAPCFGADRRPTAACAATVPHTATRYDEAMNGLAGTWWANSSLTGAPTSHTTSGPATWTSTPPAGLTSSVGFGGRMTGWLTLPAGTYRFRAQVPDDDGVRMYLDGRTVLNRWDSAAEAVLADQPVAFWRLGERSGTTAADASGKGNIGAYTSVTLAAAGALAADADTAATFNGSTSRVAGSFPRPADTFTMEGWVKPTGTITLPKESDSGTAGTGGQRWMFAPENQGTNAGAGISVGTNGVAVFEHGSNYLPALLVWPANLTGWHHIAVVYDNKMSCTGFDGDLSTPERMLVMAATRKYPAELRERAVRLVLEAKGDPGTGKAACRRIGEQLGINPDTLRDWVRQAEVDAGARPGTTTSDAARLAELEREVRELRRANAILRSASAFFAAELDRPQR